MVSEVIEIQPINIQPLMVTVKAHDNSTLITNRLPVEVVEAFCAREFGKPKVKKIRNLDEEYKSCFHYTPEGKYGVPAAAFMAAMLDSAVALNIPKTKIKRSIRVLGNVYEIRYKKLNRKVDIVGRAGINRTPDIRHRPEFIDWECDIFIQYDADLITPETIINLINRSGFSSGICEWRPSAPNKPGTFGMYEVKCSKNGNGKKKK